MRKLLLIVTVLFLGLNTQAQEISTEQYSIVTKRTADWCSRCGSWGWTLFKDLVDELDDKPAIVWAAHFSGDLANPIAQGITSNLGGAGQPLFFVNETDINAGSSNGATKVAEAVQDVEDFALFPAFVGVGIEAFLDNDSNLDINAQIQFQESFDGDIFFAVYEMRDHVIAPQASQGNQADHRHMLTAEMLENSPFGTMVTSGAITAGETFTFQIDVANYQWHSDDLSDIQFIGVVWNRADDGSYRYFNAFPTTLQMVSNTQVVNSDQITYKVVNDQLAVSVEGISEEMQVSLISTSGKFVANQTTSQSSAYFQVGNLAAGIYIININGEGFSTSKRVFIGQ